MIQSFLDEFHTEKKKQVTLAEPNTVLKKPEPGEILVNKDQYQYLSRIGKMMYMIRWSRLDIYNATHD